VGYQPLDHMGFQPFGSGGIPAILIKWDTNHLNHVGYQPFESCAISAI
jgi:hypothetical protein